MPLPEWPASERFLRECAFSALEGMGDATLGEWEEWSGKAYHLRRRLSHKEQRQVGDVVDVRGTAEGKRRYDAVLRYIPAHMRNWYEWQK